MDVPTLILLGASGGMLRGLIEVYNRFLEWQADRREHRAVPGGAQGEPPQFQGYFDPVADPIAAVVHSALGAGAAVLFGTTGQISGAYAAFVVGISAPVILTQLGRIESVGEAVAGAQNPVARPADAALQPEPPGAVGQAVPSAPASPRAAPRRLPATGAVSAAYAPGDTRAATGGGSGGQADIGAVAPQPTHLLPPPPRTPARPPQVPPAGGEGAAR
ncbi:hypothetical protein [Streptomyces hundungensis]|uniref:hypothetical protein n=1 Tax=Streptomyces hundungensis TaxID=1077946 RepID=UPI0034035BA6